VNQLKQLLTCMGAHPIDVAYGYFAGSAPAPDDCVLPILDYPIENLPEELKGKKYAVIPVGNTAPARRTTGKHLNPIIRHLNSKGILPVFLGKTDLLCDGKASTTFAEDIDYKAGLDLRDKTDVKQAACIMQHAQVTVGLDCGLLHLAALMQDSKIIFGYNITSVEHRAPRRNHGTCINLSVSESELICIGCQSKLKNVPLHKFSHCLYEDNKCIDFLFKNNSERWTEAIDRIVQ
jgi:ADP-heptose:LPS heptosyltransferase